MQDLFFADPFKLLQIGSFYFFTVIFFYTFKFSVFKTFKKFLIRFSLFLIMVDNELVRILSCFAISYSPPSLSFQSQFSPFQPNQWVLLFQQVIIFFPLDDTDIIKHFDVKDVCANVSGKIQLEVCWMQWNVTLVLSHSILLTLLDIYFTHQLCIPIPLISLFHFLPLPVFTFLICVKRRKDYVDHIPHSPYYAWQSMYPSYFVVNSLFLKFYLPFLHIWKIGKFW